MKQSFFILSMCFAVLSVHAQYVDLGLPSGTLWKSQNEPGFYTYDTAVKLFGDKLPSINQWSELMDKCTWKWVGDGYLVTGKNGNSITLPASGYRDCNDKDNTGKGVWGSYWIYSIENDDLVWEMTFDEFENMFDQSDNPDYYNCMKYSIRLIQNK